MTNKHKNVPELRFEGFTDAWEQCAATDIFSAVSDKGYSDLPVLSASQELGMIRRNEIGIDIKYDEKSTKNYKRVKPGQFVIHLRSFQGGFAWSEVEGITSPAYTILDFKEPEKQVSKFWKEVLTSSTFIKRLETVTYGIRDGRSISYTDFSTLKFSFPSVKEQIKIGSFFQQLDNNITIQQRKLDLLKEQKKGFLQKMFPKNGETVPELRFEGFADDWKQVRLGKVGKTQSGIGFPDAEQGGRTGIPFFKVSDMNNIGNEHEMISSNNYVSDEQLQRKKWKPIDNVPAIIFAKVGAAIMLNRKRLVRTPFLIDNNTMAYIFDENWETDFGEALFETINLPKYTQVGALPSYNSSDIERIKVKLPTKGEQTQIGKFFHALNRQITMHQCKLELLKEQKKGFLQKMFV